MNPRHLEKIKKCFELGKSGNPNEAATALAMAHKLMRKYGLSEDDINFIEMGATTTASKIQKKPVAYAVNLGTSIASSFKCEVLLQYSYHGNNFKFIGRKDTAMMSAYAFDVLFRQLKLARKAFLATIHPRTSKQNKTKRADCYCDGWVNSVVRNLDIEELPPEEKERITNYRKHIGAYTEKKAKSRQRKGGSISDYLTGSHDGKNVHVNTPIHGSKGERLCLQ